MRNRLAPILCLLMTTLLSLPLCASFSKIYRLPLNSSNNYISALCQDRDGVIWIGTRSGLLRYDGYGYYDCADMFPGDAVSSHIRCFYVGDDGRLWIGTEKGAMLYDETGFHLISGELEACSIKSIRGTSNGMVLFATGDGLYICDVDDYRHQSVVCGENGQHFMNRRWIVSDNSGRLWTGYSDQLACFSFGGESMEPSVKTWTVERSIKVLYVDDKGGMYYTTEDDCLYYCRDFISDIPGIHEHSTRLLSGSDVRGIAIHGEQVRVITSYNGVISFRKGEDGDPSYVETFWINDDDHSDISNGILCVMSDAKGNFYYGTAEGLYAEWSLDTRVFHNLSGGRNGSLLRNVVSDVCQADERLWVSTNRGLEELVVDGTDVLSIKHHMLPSKLAGSTRGNSLQCICPDGDIMWVGTKSGIYLFDERSGDFSISAPLAALMNADGAAFCKSIFADVDGNVWFGLIYGGLYVMKDDECIRVSVEGSDATASNVYKVLVDSSKDVWVGTKSRGLLRFNLSDMHRTEKSMVVSDALVYFSDGALSILDIYEDSRKNILVATSAGVYVHDEMSDGGMRLVTDSHGLYNGIVQDNDGNYWLSSLSGVSRLSSDKGDIHAFDMGNTSFSLIDYNTGCCRTKDNILFFGGINGLTYFNPTEVSLSAVVRRAHLSNVTVMGKPVTCHENGRLSLSHSDNHITVSVSSLVYPADMLQNYYYKVNGMEDKWMPMCGNTVSFAKLSPGHYDMSFSCSESREDGFSLAVDVAHPWWRTWWAYMLYILSFALIAGTLFGLVVSRSKSRYQMRTLLNVTHGLKTPLCMMKVPVTMLKDGECERRDELLGILERNADKLDDTINQILELRKVDRNRSALFISCIDICDFLTRIGGYFLPYFADKSINFIQSYPTAPCPVYCDPEKLELVVFNLLQNAYTFTPEGGEVSMSLSANGKTVSLCVADSGIGIDKKYHKKIFSRFWQLKENGAMPSYGTGIGLSLVKEYVKLHGGNISLDSDLGFGSEFTVTIPRNKFRYMSSNRIEHVNPAYTKRYAASLPINKVELNHDGTDTIFVLSQCSDLISLVSSIFTGYRISFSASPEDSYDLIVGEMPATVLIDVPEPFDEAILSICRRLKANHKTADIPVIYLTNDDSPAVAKLYYENGGDSHIAKPFDPELLKIRVEKLIRKNLNVRERIKVERLIASREVIEAESADQRFIREMMEIVERNIPSESFSLENFAMEAHVSKSILSSRIRTITGYSPMELMRNARMQRAAQLLATKAYDVTQVSYMVGFADPRYFATCFKKQYNCTPSQYQNKK